YEHQIALAVAVTKAARIREHGGRPILIESPPRVLTRDILAELIRSRIVTEHLVNRGTEAEPRLEIQYVPVEPTEMDLRALLAAPGTDRTLRPHLEKGGSLLARVPRV